MLNILKSLVLFENLPDETLMEIQNHCVSVHLKKDNIVFYEGEESRYIYFLLSGQVKLYKTSANNHELILKYFSSNELIAEVASFEHIPYPATAVALNDISLLKIDFEYLRELFFSEPALLLKVQVSLIKKIKNLENVISRYLVLDAKCRVIEYILENTEQFFSLKKNEVAQILNITPETLSRILKPFKDDGIINIKEKKVNKQRLSLYKN
ncbi:Crp/Fnr family transcriptional regulator [bacterium]|nr:Crp/Fnr family transcriptional regulator [bacterium]MBU1993545.1 Crp/Fnr family transcriptional regulator [bacterium]